MNDRVQKHLTKVLLGHVGMMGNFYFVAFLFKSIAGHVPYSTVLKHVFHP